MMERTKAAPAFESWEGRVLRGKYRVGSKLGSGGWGSVYEAEHLVLERRVALKFLHPDVADEPNARERLRREAIAASRTGHPNIVEVIDLDVLPDGREFIVLELLDGKPLSQVLATEHAFSVRRAHGVFVQIADALAAAHRARVVHRDLKPENVHLCPRPGGELVKILDFGIAKLKSGSSHDQDTFTGAGEVLGTPRYMAPEQVRGDPKLDHRADIHALGLIVYEMLAGCGPYDSPDLPTFLQRLMHEIPVPLAVRRSDVSRGLSDLVQRMLAKEPRDRPQTADELGQVLARIAREGLSDVVPVVPRLRPNPSPQRALAPAGADARTLTIGQGDVRAPIPPSKSATRASSAPLPKPSQPPRVDEPSVVISVEYLTEDPPPDDEGPTEAHALHFDVDDVPKPPTRRREATLEPRPSPTRAPARPASGALRKRRLTRPRRTLVRAVRKHRLASQRLARFHKLAFAAACIAVGAISAVVTWMLVR